MDKRTTKEFTTALKRYEQILHAKFNLEHSEFFSRGESITYSDINLSGISLIDLTFTVVVFENCTFKDLRITGCDFGDCDFINCKFINVSSSFTSFFNTGFQDCFFEGGDLGEIRFSGTAFEKVHLNNIKELSGVRFGNCSFKLFSISNALLSHVEFDNSGYLSETLQFSIDKSSLSHCIFYWMNLLDVKFSDCVVSASSFINCKIGVPTLSLNTTVSEKAYSSIDLQSILESEIPNEILSNVFGIFNSEIKHYIFEMVSKVELNTVFISYSFKDARIVKRIDESLRAKGVFTFLWEKDAPIGRKLKDIMSTNINKYDKLLFVASENSLKSEACHFELTEARKKQNKNWSVVYFPVYIDKFLFAVQSYDVPRKFREEFVLNIEELREINCYDFIEFNRENIDEEKFDAAINKLVKDLRKVQNEG